MMPDDSSWFLIGFGVFLGFVLICVIISLIINIVDAFKVRKKAKGVLKSLREIDEKHQGSFLNGMEFSDLFNEMFFHEGDWIIDTGNWENVNRAVMESFARKVADHPLLFQLFFHY